MYKKQCILDNGEIIHYFDVNETSQHVLMLIHGNFSASDFFDTFIESIPKSIRIIAPDLRGFGDSSYYQKFNSLKELAQDLELFLDLINISKLSVLGWSLGGGVAMELAAFSKRIEKLILVNSTTHKGYPMFKKDSHGKPLENQGYENKEAMAFDPVQVAPVVFTLKNQYYDGIKYLYDTLIFTNKKPTVEQEKRWYQSSLKQRNIIDADWALANQNMSKETSIYKSGENTIKNIQVPTLHIWGKNDKTTPESMIMDNVDAIPFSKLIVYDECGHAPFVDKPTELLNDIKSFINV